MLKYCDTAVNKSDSHFSNGTYVVEKIEIKLLGGEVVNLLMALSLSMTNQSITIVPLGLFKTLSI